MGAGCAPADQCSNCEEALKWVLTVAYQFDLSYHIQEITHGRFKDARRRGRCPGGP